MVLLEAVRPADLARFLQHEMDVAPVEKIHVSSNEPHREKTGLRGLRPCPTQTGLYNHRRRLEA